MVASYPQAMPVQQLSQGKSEKARYSQVTVIHSHGLNHNLLGCFTHLCPRGPEAYGSGPTGVRRGTLDKAWLGRVEGTDIRRAGPTRAVGQECAVGNADPITGAVGMNGIFPVHVIDPFIKAEIDRDRDPIPTQRIPRLHTVH